MGCWHINVVTKTKLKLRILISEIHEDPIADKLGILENASLHSSELNQIQILSLCFILCEEVTKIFKQKKVNSYGIIHVF